MAHAEASTEKPGGPNEFFRQVADWSVQAAEALEHAHQMGIVHRDIKPANLLVDKDGHLWITDFGLAMTQTETNLTMTGDVLGTLRYMSPEQAVGKSRVLDHHTDIYSLGVTLYELLTLRPAFDSDDRQRLTRQIVDDDPPGPRQLNRSIPSDLETIVLKAMAKEPQDRYATAQELADDLKRFLADEPIRARRPSLAARATKWSRRHRPIVWSAVASGFVVLAALLVSTVSVLGAYQKQKTQRDLAQQNARRAEENAVSAQRNYETAREAVQQMLMRVADEELVRIPEMNEIRRRLLEDAAAFYTRLLKLNPRDSRAYYERARVYELLGEYDKVRPDYEKASQLDPDNAQVHRAAAYFLTHCPDVAYHDGARALVHAKWAVQLDPDSAASHGELAHAYEHLGDREKARTEYLRMTELNPSDYHALSLACKLAKDYQGALEALQNAVHCNPDDAWAYHSMGAVYFKLGEYEKAIGAHTKAIDLSQAGRDESADTRRFLRYAHRGDAYAGLEMYEQALADYDKAVELGPFWSPTYKRRGLAHFRLGNYNKALADIAKAVELKPDDTGNLTWIPLNEVANCPEESFRTGILDLADKLVELNKGAANAHDKRISVYAAFGREEEAIGDLEAAVAEQRDLVNKFRNVPAHRERLAELRSTLAQAYRFRADGYSKKGDVDKAIADYTKIIELKPDEPLPWQKRALDRCRQGRWNEAAADFSKAIELGKGQADVWYWRAVARLGANDTDGYRTACAEMLERFGGSEDPRECHWPAWTCALAPGALPEFSAVVSAAERAVGSEPKSAFYSHTLGAILHRAGRFEDAVDRLSEADKLTEEADAAAQSSPAYNWYFLAMAHDKLGHEEEAKRWLDKATQWTDRVLGEHEQGTTTLAWNRRLTLKLLREEAEGMVSKDER